MSLEIYSLLLVGLALGFALVVFGWRLRAFNALARPVDRSTPKASPRAGVGYAFTVGLLPWAKESTRRHSAAYLRGVAFHLAVFVSLTALLAGPWLGLLPAGWRVALALVSAVGALCGFAGFGVRFLERNLRALSTPDDYFSVALVTLFLAATTAALLNAALQPAFYLAGAMLLVYAPLGKIRHCVYFGYARLFFGQFAGRRAVLPHPRRPR